MMKTSDNLELEKTIESLIKDARKNAKLHRFKRDTKIDLYGFFFYQEVTDLIAWDNECANIWDQLANLLEEYLKISQ